MNDNLVLMSDSYKFTHWKQYPPSTTIVHSYFESRGGKFKETVFFGLQYLLKKYLEGPVITKYKVDEAEQLISKHLGSASLFNREGWMHIVDKYGGRLPVSIKAVPEGSVTPILTPLISIENTDPKCYWLTNFLETLLVQTWYPITVATLSHEMKRVILKSLEETGDPNLIGFKLHDFGFRGVSSTESAGIGGAAHLVNFMGTDTVAALVVAKEYYGADMAGFSIPAAEHSTITSWGKDHEVDAYDNMLTQYPEGLMACVSDSYDIFKACSQYWGKDLKDKVINRNGTLVVRPDPGVPEEVVIKVLELLGAAFGYEVNTKGFKVLNPKVRVIQGDGIDYDSVQDILGNMKVHGWSADNIAFGMGGALLQKLNRDTQMFAFKASYIGFADGTGRDVFKQPVTQEWKRSKPGRMNPGPEVFRDGKILIDYSLDDIRKMAALPISELVLARY